MKTKEGSYTITPVRRWIVEKTTEGKKGTDKPFEVDDINIAMDGEIKFFLDGKEIKTLRTQIWNKDDMLVIQKALIDTCG